MIFQTAMNAKLAEAVYRSCLNSATKTQTITAASLYRGQGMPIVLSTADADGYQVQGAATSTDVGVNNLYIGNLDHSLGTVDTYLAGEDAGVVQCYGYDSDAVLYGRTDTIAAGVLCIPEMGYLITCGNPVTAAGATGTTVHAFPAGLGGLAVLAGNAATVATSATQDIGVFLRCM